MDQSPNVSNILTARTKGFDTIVTGSLNSLAPHDEIIVSGSIYIPEFHPSMQENPHYFRILEGSLKRFDYNQRTMGYMYQDLKFRESMAKDVRYQLMEYLVNTIPINLRAEINPLNS